MFCREHAVQLRDDEERFLEVGAGVAFIGAGSLEAGARFAEERSLWFPVFISPKREAHRLYGVTRGSWNQVAGPRLAARALKASARKETRQGKVTSDPRQMAGTFVVSTGGVIRLAHRNRDSADNPSNEVIFRSIEGLAT